MAEYLLLALFLRGCLFAELLLSRGTGKYFPSLSALFVCSFILFSVSTPLVLDHVPRSIFLQRGLIIICDLLNTRTVYVRGGGGISV